MDSKDKKVMIFDLNGVLLNYVDIASVINEEKPGLVQDYNSAFKEYPDYRKYYNKNKEEWDKAIEITTMFERALDNALKRGEIKVRLIDGVEEMLYSLNEQGVLPVVLTTGTKEGTRIALEEAGINKLVDEVYSVFDLTPRELKVKTPEAFQRLASNYSPENIIGYADDKLLNLFNAVISRKAGFNFFKVGSLSEKDYKLFTGNDNVSEKLGIKAKFDPERNKIEISGGRNLDNTHYESGTRGFHDLLRIVQKPYEITNQIITSLNKTQ